MDWRRAMVRGLHKTLIRHEDIDRKLLQIDDRAYQVMYAEAEAICARNEEAKADLADWESADDEGRPSEKEIKRANLVLASAEAQAAALAHRVARVDFLEEPVAQAPVVEACPEPEHATASSEQPALDWEVHQLKAEIGYGPAVFRFVKGEHDAGRQCPRARDVVDAFFRNKPREIYDVRQDGFTYYVGIGTKHADLRAIAATIARMVTRCGHE